MLTSLALFAMTAGAPVPSSTPGDGLTPKTDGHVIEFPSRDRDMEIVSDTEIIIDGHTFGSWEAVVDSGYYHQHDTRCGLDHSLLGIVDQVEIASQSDCNFSRTRVLSEYDPGVEKYRIPVVVHVIQRTNGTGFLSESQVRSQIDILNEDFLALAGTNGRFGNDAQIEFYLATEDPSGNPTDGITYSTNNSWFNDSGSYWNSLAWDTDRYLNIYTNSASGALGYVPDLPQGGIAGSNSDRVVVLYSSFGRNAPLQSFNLGRTATHEVGHYLGLYHTFNGGCSNSLTSGDRIADTNPESSPTYGCPGGRTSCGLPAPFDNYMDYSDDRCMEQFTPQQVNRMRCTLLNWRPQLFEIAGNPMCSPVDYNEPFGALTFSDVTMFLTLYAKQDPAADLSGDGNFTFADVTQLLTLYAAGCP